MPVFSALSQFLSLLKMYVFSSCPYCESQLTFLPSFKANKVPVNIQIAIMITKKKKKKPSTCPFKKDLLHGEWGQSSCPFTDNSNWHFSFSFPLPLRKQDVCISVELPTQNWSSDSRAVACPVAPALRQINWTLGFHLDSPLYQHQVRKKSQASAVFQCLTPNSFPKYEAATAADGCGFPFNMIYKWPQRSQSFLSTEFSL